MPDNKNSYTVGPNFDFVHIRQPGILGYMVQPFIQFPPQQHDEKGVQACHTEDKLDHNHLGNKSVEVTLTDCNYDNPWPVDQTFFIYIISKTHGGATRIKSFENMLLQAIRQMTSGL